MKLNVRWSVDKTSGDAEIDLNDMGITDKQWKKFPESTKNAIVQEAIDELLDVPSMFLDSFSEI